MGYYIGKSWNLPRYLCEAIHDHHQVERAFDEDSGEPKKKTLLAILKMSEHICSTAKMFGDHDEDYEWNRVGSMILEFVGLTFYEYEQLAAQVGELGLGGTDYVTP